ncbi:hypothetical protein D9M68_785050 [compost metagenome]
MTATALEHNGHLALVVQGAGNARSHQRLVVGGQAAVEAREQRRVIRLRIGRLLRVIGVVEADADNLARLTHQRQIILLANLHDRPLGIRAEASQIHPTLQQRFQGLLPQYLDAFCSTNAQHGAALMIERHVTHG